MQRALPVGAHAEKRQAGADRAEQRDADHGAGDGSATAGDRRAADDHGGDDLHLDAGSDGAGHLGEAAGVERRGKAGEQAARGKARHHDAVGPQAEELRRLGVAAGGVDRAPQLRRAQEPRAGDDDRQRERR